MAHKKGVGSSKNGRESASQRLGIKIFGGQGKDDTLYALIDGTVNFHKGKFDKSVVSVIPAEA